MECSHENEEPPIMPSDSNKPGSQTARVRVYRRGPWPIRLVGAAFLVVGLASVIVNRQRSPGILIILALMAALLVLSSERSGVRVSPEGIRNVPLIGRTRTYPWSAINSFAIGKVPGGYGGPVVSMSLTNRTVYLTATEYRFGGKRAIEQICDELNAELRRAHRGHN